MRSSLICSLVFALISVAPANGAVTSLAPASAISPGMQVVDVAGNAVGTVQSVRGKELILKTNRHEVRLPIASFTPDKGRLVFGMSQEALNRETDALLAAAQANLQPGSEVRGRNGALVGHIDAINDAFVTLKLLSGEKVRLPRSSVAPRAKSAVVGVTVEELQRMAQQALGKTP